MSEIEIEWTEPAKPCDDCGELLDHVATKHGQEGFGHYRRCCACYERRQRGMSQTKRR